MKMTKPFSAIAKSPKEEKKEQALEALEDYSEGYAYIELYSGETTDYSELKSGARKYANELASKRIAKQQAKMESSEISASIFSDGIPFWSRATVISGFTSSIY